MRVLVPLLLLASPVAHAQAVQVDRIVATIGTRAITRSELDARVKKLKAAREAALEAMIDETLIAQDATKRGITVSDEEVERAITMVIEQNKLSREDFLKALGEQHYTLDEYRTAIGLQLLELRWLNTHTASREKPASADELAAWMAGEKKKALDALRAKAAVEVRP